MQSLWRASSNEIFCSKERGIVTEIDGKKTWHKTRSLSDKTKLNKVIAELKRLLSEVKNKGIQMYLKNLDATVM